MFDDDELRLEIEEEFSQCAPTSFALIDSGWDGFWYRVYRSHLGNQKYAENFGFHYVLDEMDIEGKLARRRKYPDKCQYCSKPINGDPNSPFTKSGNPKKYCSLPCKRKAAYQQVNELCEYPFCQHKSVENHLCEQHLHNQPAYAKQCSKCQETKNFDLFYRYPFRPDRRATVCKQCRLVREAATLRQRRLIKRQEAA